MLSDSELRERLGPLGPPPEPPRPPRRTGLVPALAILVLLLWGGGVALILHLERISPSGYDASSGHVYWFSDHRPGGAHIVYLTANERYAAYSAIGLPLLATLAVILFALARKPEVSRSS